jgi:hypothetical protein
LLKDYTCFYSLDTKCIYEIAHDNTKHLFMPPVGHGKNDLAKGDDLFLVACKEDNVALVLELLGN